jgi:hypothetical protein
MSLFVVTVKDSANADKGRARVSNRSNAINVFLFTNEPAVVYNPVLPSITFCSHYIRNTWNGRSGCLGTENRRRAAGAAAIRLKRNASISGQTTSSMHENKSQFGAAESYILVKRLNLRHASAASCSHCLDAASARGGRGSRLSGGQV